MHKLSQKLAVFFKKIILVSGATSMLVGASLNAASAAPKEVFSDRYAAIVIDANSGKTLFTANANAQRYPASLTKMMTLYLLYEAMDSGRVAPSTPIPVSAHAASRPPTKLGFKPGETIPAEIAAKALITKSANDVAVAIGEYLGGTESHFAQIMTEKAHQLGMMNTHFANASGLPDRDNYSTARDLATLSLALRDHFPQKYKWFKTLSFRFRGKNIRTHNHLVQRMKGVDGIKTGYTNMSGANLASSMRVSGKNIVAVVMGGRSAKLRDTHMVELLHRYLPKSTTKKTRPLIVASATYSFKPAWDTPVPSSKNQTTASSLLLASNFYQDNSKTKTIPVPLAKRPLDLISPIITALANDDLIQKNPAKDAIASILTADNSSLFSNNLKNEDKEIEKTTQNPNKNKSQWSLQIGSLNSKKQADILLNKAKTFLIGDLKNAQAYTVEFSKGKKHFYRARLQFATQENAQKACLILKKKKFECYTLQTA